MALDGNDLRAYQKVCAERDQAVKDRNAAAQEATAARVECARLTHLLASASKAVGHNITDDICRQIAEKAGRATIDAILSALGATRRKPTADEEQARIARMTPAETTRAVRARLLDTEPDDGEAEMRRLMDPAQPVVVTTPQTPKQNALDAALKFVAEQTPEQVAKRKQALLDRLK